MEAAKGRRSRAGGAAPLGGSAPAAESGSAPFRRDLGLVDVTLLVVGSMVGADVYVVAGMGASVLGPAQLVAWVAAGVLTALIALAFVQCAAIDPQVGGSYAYAHAAFGPLVGFLAGWALYVGEWVSLPVFPLAFVNYLGIFAPGLPREGQMLVMTALIAAVTVVNVFGARVGGRVNDVLTVAKLVPLALLAAAGLLFTALRPGAALSHLTPFAPLGWGGFGAAVVPIFWAYAGFELAVLPAGEVRRPRRTLPRGLVAGVAIATLVYLLVGWSVVAALPWRVTAASARPLADALGAVVAAFGGTVAWGRALMGLGALLSVAGVYVVFTLSLARLSYALAAAGLFPRPFAWLHPTFRTPWAGLAAQAVSALALVRLGELRGLIETSVLFLAVCYVLTGLAALRLVARNPDRALRLPALRALLALGVASGAYLAIQVPPRRFPVGAAAMALGLGWCGWLRWRGRRPVGPRPVWRGGEAGTTLREHRHGAWLWRSLREPRPPADGGREPGGA